MRRGFVRELALVVLFAPALLPAQRADSPIMKTTKAVYVGIKL